MKKIEFNDVALRESGQVEGGNMSPMDQQTYLKMLIEGGIDRVEIGYPGSSAEQLEQTRRLVKFVADLPAKRKPLLSGLATASEQMIDAVAVAGCDVCHIYIPSSEEFIRSMFKAEQYGDTLDGKQQWVIDQSVVMIEYAKKKGFTRIQYSPEDAARSGREFLRKLVEAVITAGATIINIPDTTGLRILGEFGDLIRHIKATVPNIGKVQISVHCHNDSDNATNNTLQAILAGADIVEGTFYGLGERSGMTKFESVLMNLATRTDVFGDYQIAFDISYCVKLVKFIASALGMPVPRHWPVVGWQNSICSSGTHQALEDRAEKPTDGYYGWLPIRFGHPKVKFLFNQSSGRAGLNKLLVEMDYHVSKEDLEKIFEEAKKTSDAKNGAALDDLELTAIVQNINREVPYLIKVIQCQALGGQGTIPYAVIVIDVNGRQWQCSSTGDGPFDAIMKAVVKGARTFYPELKKVEIKLVDWRPIPVNRGSESLADVYAAMRFGNGDGQIFAGRDVHLDTIQASAQAFANCISWYLFSLLGASKNS